MAHKFIISEPKIELVGKEKDIKAAEELIKNLELIKNEYKDRLLLQELLDEKNIKADIMYEGNGIWSRKKIIKEKAGSLNKMSNCFYKFLYLIAGSIAHYNKYGWIEEYEDSAEKLKQFFLNNEYGNNVLQEQPGWKADTIMIAKDILAIINGEKVENHEKSKNKKEKNNSCQLNLFDMMA